MTILYVFIAFLTWCEVCLAQSNNSPVLQTTIGSVRGVRRTVLGKDVDVFLGIPYAEPPVGERRFRRPELIKPWKDTRDCLNLPPTCNQLKDKSFNEFAGVKMWNPNTNISEDCLYLNIWQPVGGSSNKAVLIWVYGGGFYSGSSTLSLYDGSILAAEGDVVVMSMQYRLGPFGFIYLKGGTNERDGALGNMGLLDQNLAIRWMKENAAVFGGDPSRITLFGESAGAGSVSLHLLSPLTQNMIQSSIMQSGTAVGHWACDSQERAHAGGLEFAGLLGCYSGNGSEPLNENDRVGIVDCLRKLSAEELTKTQFQISIEQDVIHTPFGPTVDDFFLTEKPKQAAVKDAMKRQSIMLGANNDEGMYFLLYTLKDLLKLDSPTLPKISKSEFNEAIPIVFYGDKRLVADVISFEYGVPLNFDEDVSYAKALDNAVGDFYFKCPVAAFGKLYAEGGKKVYMYHFSHRTSANPWPAWSGVLHGYEIDHVFGQPLNSSLKYRPEEVSLSKKMVKYWTNFAKTGDPNKGSGGVQDVDIVWPLYETSRLQVLVLNTSGVSVQPGLLNPDSRKCLFWSTVYPKIKPVADHSICSSTSIIDLSEIKITAALCLVIAVLCRSGLL